MQVLRDAFSFEAWGGATFDVCMRFQVDHLCLYACKRVPHYHIISDGSIQPIISTFVRMLVIVLLLLFAFVRTNVPGSDFAS